MLRPAVSMVHAALIGATLIPTTAGADPVAPCTSNVVALRSFGPCVFRGDILLSRVTATVGQSDVGDALSMAYNVDAYPPDEAPWLIVGYPGTAFADSVSARTPLEVGYRLTALNGTRISLVDLALMNAAYVGFRSAVEFALQYDNGVMDVVRLGWDGQTFLGDRVLHSTGRTRFIDVRTRVLGTSAVMGGGGGPGLFPLTSDPAPVPEPATVGLCGVGLLLACRRRHGSHNQSKSRVTSND